MKRLGWFSLVCMLVLAMGVPVLAQDAETESDALPELEPWVCPEGFAGQSLNVYNWSTYIAEDTISNFEEACGVKVIYDVYESNEALMARLREGNPGYDIIVPTDYIIQIMIAEEILHPLDLDLIPNFAYLSEDLLDSPFDPGNQYSIPYQWGTVGIGYNAEVVGEEITSWQQLFDYEGPVAWLEDPRFMINLGLTMSGNEPNATTAEAVSEARELLIASGRNVVTIAQDDGQAHLERGDVDMAIEYSGDIFQIAVDDGTGKFIYVIPEEGAQLWMDNLAIPTGAPNVELAHVFIDYILDPYVSADIANYTAFGSPNQASIDYGLIDAELLANEGIYPSDEAREVLYSNVELLPEVDQAYLDAWDEVKIFLGR